MILILGLLFSYWVVLWMANIPSHKVDAKAFRHGDALDAVSIGIKFTPRHWNPRYWTSRRKLKALDVKQRLREAKP